MSEFICVRNKWLLFPCAGWPRRSSISHDGMCAVPVNQQRDARGQTWDWDGNVERPTISPSINCGDCGWHGHIVNGEFNPPREPEPQADGMQRSMGEKP